MTLLLTLLLACGGAEEAPAPAPEAPAEEAPATEAPAAEAPAKEEAAPEAGAVPNKVNLNTGTDEQFLAVMPDLGKKMLHEFEEYRPYKSIKQFRKEMAKYVPKEKIAEYEQHVYVPIAYNSCDPATLSQIPGIDAGKAQALIDGRPYGTPDLFVKAVGEQLDTDASGYLAWLAE